MNHKSSQELDEDLLDKKKKNKAAQLSPMLALGLTKKELSVSVDKIQDDLAPRLRERAVHHLRTAETATARGFRGELVAAGLGHSDTYLDEQAKNGVWATNIEACALGEVLGCNVVVTSILTGRPDETWCLHLESLDAPTIHLYNDNNNHWSDSKTSATKGDGNCLYNAVAKTIQTMACNSDAPNTSPLSANSLYHHDSSTARTYSEQKAILSAIKSEQLPDQLDAKFILEKQRIDNLPAEQRDQIEADHEIALMLAQNKNPTEADYKIALTRAQTRRQSMEMESSPPPSPTK